MSERTYVLFGCILFLIGILLFIYDVLSSELSVKGDELYTLEQQTKYYDKQNEALRIKLWEAESYQEINRKARSQGFTESTRYYVLH